MSEKPPKKTDTQAGRDAIPQCIAQWARLFPKTSIYTARFQRFVDFWMRDYDSARKIDKAWSELEAAAKSEDDLVTLFAVMPDKPEVQPFAAIYQAREKMRVVDPGEERRRYDNYLKSVKSVIELINPHGYHFEELMRDAQATPDSHEAAIRFRSTYENLLTSMLRLRELLEKIDPAAKIPTKHWAAPDAAQKNYVIQVASLNRYLSTPKHAALAFLANVNYQTTQITADQIRKSWLRGADKRA